MFYNAAVVVTAIHVWKHWFWKVMSVDDLACIQGAELFLRSDDVRTCWYNRMASSAMRWYEADQG
jgi:hypothetical protein